MNNGLKIKLTQICEPNEIYLKFLEGEKAKKNEDLQRKINIIQEKLSGISKKSTIIKNPIVGNIYGCYIDVWKKWVRGKIITQFRNGYKVFLIDYGYYKTNIKEFIEAPNIVEIDLKAQPFSRVSLPLKPINSKGWCDSVSKICRDINDKKDSLYIRFIAEYEDKDIYFGDLHIFENDEKHYSLSEKLVSLKLADNQKLDLRDLFNQLQNKNIGPIRNVLPKKRLELYKNTSNNGQFKEFVRPKNLVIGGKDLKPAWNTADKCDFYHFYKKKISSKNLSIQQYVWPQLSSKKHAIIISSNQESLTSSYLLPLLNSITVHRKRGQNPQDLGPKAIIFANNSLQVDEIAKMCREYTENLSNDMEKIEVYKAVGMCKDQRIHLFNGCSILVATPPGLIKLLEGISIKVINENRLKWVVFDNLDQDSFKKVNISITTAMKTLYSGAAIPQTIVASKGFSSFMKNKFLMFLPKDDTIIFIDNFLDASTFVGLKFSVKISSGNDDNIEEIFREPLNNSQKIVVVLNDTEIANDLASKLSNKGINALFCENTKIAKVWDESCLNKCILIVTDSILNEADINNADNLIHFDLPSDFLVPHSTSDQFSKRFKLFHSAIYGKLTANEPSTLKTTIVLNNENVELFEGLLNFMAMRNFLKDNEKIIENMYERKETIKCSKNESLCTTLLQFGKCSKYNCQKRHKLSEQDKPPSYLDPVKSFIIFEMISMQGPTNFVIKIREYYSNKWVSYDQSNQQQKLENDLQKSCMEKKNSLALNEARVGDIYAKYDSNLGKYVRVKMIKRNSNGIVIVNMLDYVTTSSNIPALEKNLLKLSDEFTKINPVIAHLQVMNLVPFDCDLYSNEQIYQLSELMNKIPKKAVYVAKVESKIKDVLFTKDLEAKLNDKTVFRLKSAHAKLNISQVNLNIAVEISKLAAVFNDPPKQITSEKPKHLENVNSMMKKSIRNENWKQLKYRKSYSITLHQYISPYSFYVVIYNPDNLTVKTALQNIENSKDQKPLINIAVNECCLAEIDNRKFRAKILNISNNSVDIFLVDYGETHKCDKFKLYEIPESFLNLDFQAVHCSMLGICPKYNMNIWPSLQKSAIHNLLQNFNERKSLKMRVVKKDEKKSTPCGINSFYVLLYDDESKLYLNKLAVKKGIANECTEIDYNDDHYESTSEEDSDSALDENTLSDVSLDSENLNKLEKLFTIYNNSVKEENSSYNEKFINSELTDESTVAKKSSLTEISTSMLSTQSSMKALSSLNNIFKLPFMEWRQNAYMIYILVSAKDCQDYALKVSEETMDVIIKYNHEKIERTIIQFYGLVNEKLCSHELTGINITIRLPKKIVNRNWPRLTMSKEKSFFIKFSAEKVPSSKFYTMNEMSYSGAPDFSDEENYNVDNNNSNSSSDDEILF